ncbi:hypothetical protein Ae201684P_006942 [Aphanomyces euteiches]|nr:hypothetical protein Ae201684P_006942 [Aphanomyces euteiches]
MLHLPRPRDKIVFAVEAWTALTTNLHWNLELNYPGPFKLIEMSEVSILKATEDSSVALTTSKSTTLVLA